MLYLRTWFFGLGRNEAQLGSIPAQLQSNLCVNQFDRINGSCHIANVLYRSHLGHLILCFRHLGDALRLNHPLGQLFHPSIGSIVDFLHLTGEP